MILQLTVFSTQRRRDAEDGKYLPSPISYLLSPICFGAFRAKA